MRFDLSPQAGRGVTTSADSPGDGMMALARDFKETVKARAERDIAFREALLTEAVELLIAGDIGVGKALLRDYISAVAVGR